ncbi:Phenazine biosynthesis-like protein [Corynebacterium capitovis DSM 44611]|uniref:PhzF family phenazine biosynthesis protein n=1 Tax=Corynebacterium capitovis TaxID=131081 RepID=UPI00039D27CF|nr:PhzF family phenazine biosynthesis protein [Corynebacterium capitovis]WKD57781.1 Phenazine biosynthesis-like protein [Corynebacterium capitovis DSM 44611]
MRIFTPTEEFPFAGHPTLGSAGAWLELGGRPARQGEVVQECGLGLVPVKLGTEGTLYFATPPLLRSGPLSARDLDGVTGAFGIAKADVEASAWSDNGPGWRVVQLVDVDKLAALSWPGSSSPKVGFFALTGSLDPAYEVRAFTPVGEDPVTGSLGGAVAQWARKQGLVPEEYTAAQGSYVGGGGKGGSASSTTGTSCGWGDRFGLTSAVRFASIAWADKSVKNFRESAHYCGSCVYCVHIC